MEQYNYYLKIWNELISGVVFKSRIDVYRDFYEYILTNKEYIKGVYTGKFKEFNKDEIDEIDYIITSITLGKNRIDTKLGKSIMIVNEDELRENYILVKKLSSLFEIIYNDNIHEHIKGDIINGFNISNYMSILHNEPEKEINFELINNDIIIPLHGNVIFTNVIKTNTGCIKHAKPTIDQIIDIIQNFNFNDPINSLDINKIKKLYKCDKCGEIYRNHSIIKCKCCEKYVCIKCIREYNKNLKLKEVEQSI